MLPIKRRKKPDKFGLPYDYPKDYFLQHWFSVRRVDELRLVERYPMFRWYYGLRGRAMAWGLREFKVRRAEAPVEGDLAEPVVRGTESAV